ncbi:MAG: hypothetical protein QOF69_2457 [Solirubrobacteraceae bacterium]|nr:hypothetical protein [Solirubrobacteraceae bacterium]MEA2183272.1 hypothetical protein [Solirubrobacteraceae bacterium]
MTPKQSSLPPGEPITEKHVAEATGHVEQYERAAEAVKIASSGTRASPSTAVAHSGAYDIFTLPDRCARAGARVTLAILTTDYSARPADALWLTPAHPNAES